MAGHFKLPPSPDDSAVRSRTPIPSSPRTSSSLATPTSRRTTRLDFSPRTSSSLANPTSRRTARLGFSRETLDDPGLTDGSSSSSSTTSSTPSFGLDTEFPGRGVAVDCLLHDVETFPDELLDAQAQAHLAILLHPAFAEYNTPPWSRVGSARMTHVSGDHDFTVYRFFRSMFITPTFVCDLSPRYVAAAICACAPPHVNDPRDAVQRQEARVLFAKRLAKLALTIIAWGLWPFCRSSSGATMPGITLEECDPVATPTLDLTATLVTEGVSATRGESMKDPLLRREGYACVLSDYRDKSWPYFSSMLRIRDGDGDTHLPVYGPDPIMAELHAAHIFKRSVAVLDPDDRLSSRHVKSRIITLDILRNYCRIDDQLLASLDDIDEPGNGMLLSKEAHDAVDEFMLCFLATETPNCYDVKRFDIDRRAHIPGAERFKSRVYFQDLSEEVRPAPQPADPASPLAGSSGRQRRKLKRRFSATGISLPNPELLRLHAALAGVMNLSGAAGLFKKIIAEGGAGGPAVPSKDGMSFVKHISPDLYDEFMMSEIS